MRPAQTCFPQSQWRSWTWLHPQWQSQSSARSYSHKWKIVQLNPQRSCIQHDRIKLWPSHCKCKAIDQPKSTQRQQIQKDQVQLEQSQFNIEVQNRYEILQNSNPDNDIQTKNTSSSVWNYLMSWNCELVEYTVAQKMIDYDLLFLTMNSKYALRRNSYHRILATNILTTCSVDDVTVGNISFRQCHFRPYGYK